MRDTYLQWRCKLLQNLGGLPAPSVENKEWLYLLKKETRNSIMVEGIFVKEEDLEEVLFKGNYEIRHSDEALNYFKTARFVYGLGYENFTVGELVLSLGLIRQVNKGIQEGTSREPGILRKGKVIIKGAEINPPEFDIDGWLRLYVQWINDYYDKLPLLRFASLQHSLFEAIHPFTDGNGRTGRILTNYMLLSKGFPITIVKGDDVAKESYYQALQEADTPLNVLFESPPDYNTLCKTLTGNTTEKLEELFLRGYGRAWTACSWTAWNRKAGNC